MGMGHESVTFGVLGQVYDLLFDHKYMLSALAKLEEKVGRTKKHVKAGRS